MRITKFSSSLILAGVATAVLCLCVSSAAHAQEAVAAFNGYNSAFLYQNGTTAFYNTAIGSTATQCEWTEGLDIEVAIDAYRHTHSAADRTLLTNLLNTLNVNNASGGTCGGPWEGDGWDDNLAWMVNPFLQGYLLIGNTAWLTQAEDGFNDAWNKGWDTTVAGGGIWEELPSKTSKCALSNDPFVWEGVQLYIATGDSTYLTKAKQIYEWARVNLANMTTSSNGRGASGQVNGCVSGKTGQLQELSTNVYDSGSFLEAAASLYGITGSSEYSNDAKLAIQFVQSEGTIIPYQNSGEHKHAWAYWFTRGLSDFATDAGLWGTYQTYLYNNANQAWNERNTQYNITWNDWSNPTNLTASDGAAEGNEMSSAAAIWQHLPPPAVSLSGTWEIQNVNSGLAIGVSGNSKSNSAAIVQEAFTSGNNAELWTFRATSGGYYQIVNVNSGEAMNVSGGSGLAKATIVQWPPQSITPGNDQWLPVPNSDGSYTFYNLYSYQTLGVPGSSTTVGTQLDQYFGNGGTNQAFKLIAH